eukprot:scaffold22141_cov64-Phaeocystis_antarctica.AAC.2
MPFVINTTFANTQKLLSAGTALASSSHPSRLPELGDGGRRGRSRGSGRAGARAGAGARARARAWAGAKAEAKAKATANPDLTLT